MSLKRYTFDKYGNSPLNKMVDEPYEFNNDDVRVIVSREGLFYTDGFELFIQGDSNPLVAGLDFEFIGADPELQALTGLESAAGVQLKDETFSGTVLFTAQIVGGNEGMSTAVMVQLNEMLEKILNEGFSVDWNTDVINKQRFYDGKIHSHRLSEVEDVDDIRVVFAEFNNAIKNRRPMYSSVSNILERQERMLLLIGELRKSINNIAHVSGSVEKIKELGQKIDNVSALTDLSGTALAGINKTLVVLPVGSFAYLSFVLKVVTGTSIQVDNIDIIHANGDTKVFRGKSLVMDDMLFNLKVEEVLDDVRLELNVIPGGDYQLKWLVNL